MKSILRQSVSFVLLLICTAPVFAQVTFQLGGGAGVRIPLSDYGGSTTDYYAGTQYGLSTGYNLQGKARVGLAGITLVGQFDYSSMSNSGDALASGQGKVDISQSLITFKAGPEIEFGIPALPVKPYLGANVALNLLSGDVSFKGLTAIPTDTYTMESATRVGFGFNGGVLLNLGPAMTLDIGVEYSLMNPFGRKFSAGNPATSTRVDSYRALNDDKDPLYQAGDPDHFIKNARSIQSLLFSVSILFGL